MLRQPIPAACTPFVDTLPAPWLPPLRRCQPCSQKTSTPVGFKNGTDGGLQVAVNALLSVSKPHSFLGINPGGEVAIIRTVGNGYGHVVLRGGAKGPNYDSVTVTLVEQELARNRLPTNIVIDCRRIGISNAVFPAHGPAA